MPDHLYLPSPLPASDLLPFPVWIFLRNVTSQHYNRVCFWSLKIKSWAQESNTHQIFTKWQHKCTRKALLVCLHVRLAGQTGSTRSTQWEYWVNKYLLRVTQLWYRRGFMALCIWSLLISYEIIAPWTTSNTAWLKDLPFKFENMERTGIKSVMPPCSTQRKKNINKQATRMVQ